MEIRQTFLHKQNFSFWKLLLSHEHLTEIRCPNQGVGFLVPKSGWDSDAWAAMSQDAPLCSLETQRVLLEKAFGEILSLLYAGTTMAELLTMVALPSCSSLPKDSICSRDNTEFTTQDLGDVCLGIWDTVISIRGTQLSPLTDHLPRDLNTSWGLQYFNTSFFTKTLTYHL